MYRAFTTPPRVVRPGGSVLAGREFDDLRPRRAQKNPKSLVGSDLRAVAPSCFPSSARRELPQHVLEDAAVLVVVELDGGIDAGERFEAFDAAVGGGGGDFERLARGEA